MGFSDEGSKIVLIWKDLCKELGLEVNQERKMMMQTANGGKEELEGCIEYFGIMVEGVQTYTHAFVVKSAPYCLLLGRPWQSSVRLQKVEKSSGIVEIIVTDPREAGRWVVVPTRERKDEKMRRGLMVLVDEEVKGMKIREKEDTLTEALLALSYTYSLMAHCLVYKLVANKVRLVPWMMSDDCCIIRKFPENPLDSLPHILAHPPAFTVRPGPVVLTPANYEVSRLPCSG
jgi:hypothetical protein